MHHREIKLAAVFPERVGSVLLLGKGERVLVVHRIGLAFAGGAKRVLFLKLFRAMVSSELSNLLPSKIYICILILPKK